jgi:hypothetical protein
MRQNIFKYSAFIAVLALFSVNLYRFHTFMIDDTYISLVYVQNALLGDGVTFNGQRVAGFSNPLWVFSLILLGAPGIDLVLAARALGIVCASTMLGLIYWRTARAHGWALAAIGALLLASSAPFALWTMSGMETTGFALALLAALIFLHHEPREYPRWSLVALAALMVLRPEGIGVALGLVGWQWIGYRRVPNLRMALRYGLPFVIYAGSLAWHSWYYGMPLANTVYAKTGDLSEQLTIGAAYVSTWLATYWGLALGSIAGLLLTRRFGSAQSRAWVGWLVVAIGLYMGFIIVAGGDGMPLYRFIVQIWALFILIIVEGLASVRQALSSRENTLRLRAGSAALLAIVGLNSFVVTAGQQEHIGVIKSMTHIDETIGRRLEQIRQPGDTIAVVDAGAIPYYSHMATVDMIGLNDAHIAHLDSSFMHKFDNQYVLQARPTYIQIHVIDTDGLTYPVNFIGTADLWYSAEFQRWYERMPDLVYVWRRRDQPLAIDPASFHAVGYTAQLPARWAAQTTQPVSLTLVNRGGLAWQPSSYGQPWGAVAVRVRWQANGALLQEELIGLADPVQPQQEITLDLRLKAPDYHGKATLQIELLREGWGAFADHGAARFEQTVEID